MFEMFRKSESQVIRAKLESAMTPAKREAYVLSLMGNKNTAVQLHDVIKDWQFDLDQKFKKIESIGLESLLASYTQGSKYEKRKPDLKTLIAEHESGSKRLSETVEVTKKCVKERSLALKSSAG